MNLLIGASGSVACIKLVELIRIVQENYPETVIKVVLTSSAVRFVQSHELDVECFVDDDEWKSFRKRGDPILHIELMKWANALLVAPCSANTLAKISNGLADNLLTNISRAWDWSKPFFVAPAMNTRMWEHPVTCKQLLTLQEWGIHVIPPISKQLMCGDTGVGAMEEPANLIVYVFRKAHWET